MINKPIPTAVSVSPVTVLEIGKIALGLPEGKFIAGHDAVEEAPGDICLLIA